MKLLKYLKYFAIKIVGSNVAGLSYDCIYSINFKLQKLIIY